MTNIEANGLAIVFGHTIRDCSNFEGHGLQSSTQVVDRDCDDSALMKRVASGDEEALAALYDRHSGPVYSLIRRIVQDEGAAEEILQDVFLHVWRIAPRFDQERGQLRGWLLVMARNRALSHLRRLPRIQVEDMDLYAISSNNAQDLLFAEHELTAKVRGALEELPVEQGTLLEMAYFEGMTHSEIAARTGQPLGTVKTRLRSGLTSLRRIFQI